MIMMVVTCMDDMVEIEMTVTIDFILDLILHYGGCYGKKESDLVLSYMDSIKRCNADTIVEITSRYDFSIDAYRLTLYIPARAINKMKLKHGNIEFNHDYGRLIPYHDKIRHCFEA